MPVMFSGSRREKPQLINHNKAECCYFTGWPKGHRAPTYHVDMWICVCNLCAVIYCETWRWCVATLSVSVCALHSMVHCMQHMVCTYRSTWSGRGMVTCGPLCRINLWRIFFREPHYLLLNLCNRVNISAWCKHSSWKQQGKELRFCSRYW
jgi:hypothetical protein